MDNSNSQKPSLKRRNRIALNAQKFARLQLLVERKVKRQSTLAEQEGISIGLVSKDFGLRRLPWQVIRMMLRGELGAMSAYHISKVKNRSQQLSIARMAVAENLRVCDVLSLVRLKSRRNSSSRTWSFTVGNGIRVNIKSGRMLDRTGLIKAIRSAIEKIESMPKLG